MQNARSTFSLLFVPVHRILSKRKIVFFQKMALIFHSSLSKDLALILNDSDDFNVIIKVCENQNATKEFRAHSVILRARSSYFKSALSADWAIKKDNMIMF